MNTPLDSEATMSQGEQISMDLEPRRGRMAPIERQIADLLRVRHRGQDHAIARPALVTATGIPDRHVRKVVAALIQKHGLPIGASPRGGYYWITDPDELRKAAASLSKRIVALAARYRALVGGDAAARLLGQLKLGNAE